MQQKKQLSLKQPNGQVKTSPSITQFHRQRQKKSRKKIVLKSKLINAQQLLDEAAYAQEKTHTDMRMSNFYPSEEGKTMFSQGHHSQSLMDLQSYAYPQSHHVQIGRNLQPLRYLPQLNQYHSDTDLYQQTFDSFGNQQQFLQNSQPSMNIQDLIHARIPQLPTRQEVIIQQLIQTPIPQLPSKDMAKNIVNKQRPKINTLFQQHQTTKIQSIRKNGKPPRNVEFAKQSRSVIKIKDQEENKVTKKSSRTGNEILQLSRENSMTSRKNSLEKEDEMTSSFQDSEIMKTKEEDSVLMTAQPLTSRHQQEQNSQNSSINKAHQRRLRIKSRSSQLSRTLIQQLESKADLDFQPPPSQREIEQHSNQNTQNVFNSALNNQQVDQNEIFSIRPEISIHFSNKQPSSGETLLQNSPRFHEFHCVPSQFDIQSSKNENRSPRQDQLYPNGSNKQTCEVGSRGSQGRENSHRTHTGIVTHIETPIPGIGNLNLQMLDKQKNDDDYSSESLDSFERGPTIRGTKPSAINVSTLDLKKIQLSDEKMSKEEKDNFETLIPEEKQNQNRDDSFKLSKQETFGNFNTEEEEDLFRKISKKESEKSLIEEIKWPQGQLSMDRNLIDVLSKDEKELISLLESFSVKEKLYFAQERTEDKGLLGLIQRDVAEEENPEDLLDVKEKIEMVKQAPPILNLQRDFDFQLQPEKEDKVHASTAFTPLTYRFGKTKTFRQDRKRKNSIFGQNKHTSINTDDETVSQWKVNTKIEPFIQTFDAQENVKLHRDCDQNLTEMNQRIKKLKMKYKLSIEKQSSSSSISKSLTPIAKYPKESKKSQESDLSSYSSRRPRRMISVHLAFSTRNLLDPKKMSNQLLVKRNKDDNDKLVVKCKRKKKVVDYSNQSNLFENDMGEGGSSFSAFGKNMKELMNVENNAIKMKQSCSSLINSQSSQDALSSHGFSHVSCIDIQKEFFEIWNNEQLQEQEKTMLTSNISFFTRKPKFLLKSWFNNLMTCEKILEHRTSEDIEYLLHHRKHFVFIKEKFHENLTKITNNRYIMMLNTKFNPKEKHNHLTNAGQHSHQMKSLESMSVIQERTPKGKTDEKYVNLLNKINQALVSNKEHPEVKKLEKEFIQQMNLEKQTVLDLDSIQVDQHGNFVINKQVVTIYNERYPEDQLSPTFLKKVHTQLRHIEETLDFNAEIRGEIKRMKSIMTIKHFETFIKSFLLDRDYTEIEHNGKVEKLTNSFWKMIKMEHFQTFKWCCQHYMKKLSVEKKDKVCIKYKINAENHAFNQQNYYPQNRIIKMFFSKNQSVCHTLSNTIFQAKKATILQKRFPEMDEILHHRIVHLSKICYIQVKFGDVMLKMVRGKLNMKVMGSFQNYMLQEMPDNKGSIQLLINNFSEQEDNMKFNLTKHFGYKENIIQENLNSFFMVEKIVQDKILVLKKKATKLKLTQQKLKQTLTNYVQGKRMRLTLKKNVVLKIRPLDQFSKFQYDLLEKMPNFKSNQINRSLTDSSKMASLKEEFGYEGTPMANMNDDLDNFLLNDYVASDDGPQSDPINESQNSNSSLSRQATPESSGIIVGLSWNKGLEKSPQKFQVKDLFDIKKQKLEVIMERSTDESKKSFSKQVDTMLQLNPSPSQSSLDESYDDGRFQGSIAIPKLKIEPTTPRPGNLLVIRHSTSKDLQNFTIAHELIQLEKRGFRKGSISSPLQSRQSSVQMKSRVGGNQNLQMTKMNSSLLSRREIKALLVLKLSALIKETLCEIISDTEVEKRPYNFKNQLHSLQFIDRNRKDMQKKLKVIKNLNERILKEVINDKFCTEPENNAFDQNSLNSDMIYAKKGDVVTNLNFKRKTMKKYLEEESSEDDSAYGISKKKFYNTQTFRPELSVKIGLEKVPSTGNEHLQQLINAVPIRFDGKHTTVIFRKNNDKTLHQLKLIKDRMQMVILDKLNLSGADLLKHITGKIQILNKRKWLIDGLSQISKIRQGTITTKFERINSFDISRLRLIIEKNQDQLIYDFTKRNIEKIDVQDEDGYTMLALGAYYNCSDIVRHLLRLGANPNIVTFKDQNSPLHIALEQGFMNIVDLLIEEGANENIINAFGLTPWEQSMHHCRKETIQSIFEW